MKARSALTMAPRAHANIAMKVAGAGLGARHLAMSMALPADIPAVRFPTADMPRTSIHSLKDVYALTTPTGSLAGWSAGDALVAFYGQPGRTALFYCNSFGLAGTYDIFFGQTGKAWRLTSTDMLSVEQTVTHWTASAATGQGPHGSSLPIGYSNSLPYVFLDISDTIVIPSIPIPACTFIGTIRLELWLYQGLGESPINAGSINIIFAVAGTPTAATFINTIPGYYTIVFRGITVLTSGSILASAALQSVQLVTNGLAARWHHLSMTDLDPKSGGDLTLATRARVNSCSILITNTTSMLNRSGNICAARIKSKELFGSGVSTNIRYDDLARLAEKYEDDASKGVYTFKAFSDYAEPFRDCCANVQGGSLESAGVTFDLDYTDFMHLIRINGPIANNYAVTIAAVIETQNDTSRYPKGITPYGLIDLSEARRIISSEVTWFYENPLHMSSLYGFIKNAGRALQKFAPALAVAGSIASPANAAQFNALSSAFRGLNFD